MADRELTDAEVDLIEARCEASAPGPWESFVEGRDHVAGNSFIRRGWPNLNLDDIEMVGASTEDQDFIAHSRQDIPRLIDEVRRLKRLLALLDK